MERQTNGIKFKTVSKEWDVYFDMALTMLDVIMKNNEQGKRTVMIVPVGPTDHYPILARLVNQLNVSLKNVWFFNMDEYLVTPDTCIDFEDKMSFHKRMNDEFYSKVKPELVMSENQRRFPEPGKEKEYDQLIASLGGVDLCMGGLGINGHIAFNEPFTSLTSRTGIRALTEDTLIVNSRFFDNDVNKVPKTALSVGVGTVCDSKQVMLLISGHNKARALRHCVEGGVDHAWTISALQLHTDGIIACDEAACGELKVDTYKYFKEIYKNEK